ncbi:hypothetical protein AB0C29_47865 [Actinoplanes sp. NPDC048791]|uniref:hypothetical protein n=1 Tax=Actinoplanes sp. NPDC048791 TaxID=3154623 RepID=UPI003404FA7E
MDDVGPDLSSLCRAVRDLVEAQQSLIEALSARGLLDARASGMLARLDQLKAEADETHKLATHPVSRCR